MALISSQCVSSCNFFLIYLTNRGAVKLSDTKLPDNRTRASKHLSVGPGKQLSQEHNFARLLWTWYLCRSLFGMRQTRRRCDRTNCCQIFPANETLCWRINFLRSFSRRSYTFCHPLNVTDWKTYAVKFHTACTGLDIFRSSALFEDNALLKYQYG